jgi:hypothetical protein
MSWLRDPGFCHELHDPLLAIVLLSVLEVLASGAIDFPLAGCVLPLAKSATSNKTAHVVALKQWLAAS